MSDISSEARLVTWARSAGWDARGEVPNPRPANFVTVERTGGSRDFFFDHPTWAIQVWASSHATAREQAFQLSSQLVDPIAGFAAGPAVCDVDVDSVYDFPDPDSGQARYQLTVTAMIHN